jgi:hypothetical protein
MRGLTIAGVLFFLTLAAFCILPSETYRLRYGRPLLTTREYLDSYHKVKEGMTFDEVENAIGAPHEKIARIDGATTWRYYVPSSFSPVVDGLFSIEFDANGRMNSYWIP